MWHLHPCQLSRLLSNRRPDGQKQLMWPCEYKVHQPPSLRRTLIRFSALVPQNSDKGKMSAEFPGKPLMAEMTLIRRLHLDHKNCGQPYIHGRNQGSGFPMCGEFLDTSLPEHHITVLETPLPRGAWTSKARWPWHPHADLIL